MINRLAMTQKEINELCSKNRFRYIVWMNRGRVYKIIPNDRPETDQQLEEAIRSARACGIISDSETYKIIYIPEELTKPFEFLMRCYIKYVYNKNIEDNYGLQEEIRKSAE